MTEAAENGLDHARLGSVSGADHRWVAIQKKTFANWCNEQLSAGGRSVEDLDIDLCDGVKLVALIESLQFRKIGRVYGKPTTRIQMMHNVALALQACTDDRIRLVNIGPEDIVSGSGKLILGLLWHLILRYQISANKSKAPPKKMMLQWFQGVLQGLPVSNFTTDWSDGIALNALLDYCRPGTAPNWRQLDPRNGVENCRLAMKLAKEHLNVPRVISAEDFASRELDELSAMTYLSYFIRKDSPGYYATLNWVCRQLRNTNISNLTTDWNDGYYLCAVVHSLGGTVPGWPNLDRSDKLGNCQKGLEGGRTLGVEPVLTAAELSDPNVDHLVVMALLSKFINVIPPLPNCQKLTLNCSLQAVSLGSESRFFLMSADGGEVDKSKVQVRLQDPSGDVPCSSFWTGGKAECNFIPTQAGEHTVQVTYHGEEVVGSPATFTVTRDVSKVRLLTSSGFCKVGNDFVIKVDSSQVQGGVYRVEARSHTGQVQTLATHNEGGMVVASLIPSDCSDWTIQVFLDGKSIGSPLHVSVYDPREAVLTAPESGVVGETVECSVRTKRGPGLTENDITTDIQDCSGHTVHDVTLTTRDEDIVIHFEPSKAGTFKVMIFLKGEQINGSPCWINVFDPRDVVTFGEGLKRGVKGQESSFVVRGVENGEGIEAFVQEAGGREIPLHRFSVDTNSCEFRFIPQRAGYHVINVQWRGRHLKGSPFQAKVTDRSLVTLLDDLEDQLDERDHIVLAYNLPTILHFDISQAGPGTLTAEVLGPQGKLPVQVNQNTERAEATFRTVCEGDHYIHVYWSEAPLDFSPLLGYCAGKPLPVDASKVVLTGTGAEVARATVEAEFIVDGRKAGPGKARVELKGVRSYLPVDITPMKYDCYKCTYTPPFPGGFLLFVYWSDDLIPGCPCKVTVTAKGDVSKVKVTGEGLRGGIAGHELRVFVDTKEAGPGEVTATCASHRQGAKIEIKQNEDYHYTLSVLPISAEKHLMQIRYDGEHVPGSPFVLRIGEPPDASKVRIFGPGIEDGLLYTFESMFLVETHGAGAGQLAVRVRGPRGGGKVIMYTVKNCHSFKVDMHRETENERTIKCRFSPTEPGQYVISVRWSGDHVPGSPITVNIVESQEELEAVLKAKGLSSTTKDDTMWRADI